jgi:hypothetical protein
MTKEKSGETGLLSSLADFQKLINTELEFRFKLSGQEVSIMYRRLTPDKQEECNKIYDFLASDFRLQSQEVMPPKTEKGFDTDDPTYLAALRGKAIEARAVALYWAVPMFQDGCDGKVRADVVKHIQGLGVDILLTSLYQKVTLGDLELVETANFTSSVAQGD